MKNKVIFKLIVIMILAGMALPYLALAQVPMVPVTSGPGTTLPGTPILDNIALIAAQANPAACKTFRDSVQKVSNGQAKAIWSSSFVTDPDSGAIPITSCSIVPGTWADYTDAAMQKPSGNDPNGLYGDASNRPTEYQQIEMMISKGSGLSQEVWTSAQAKATEDAGKSNVVSQWAGAALTYIFDILTAFAGVLAAMAGGIFSYFVEIATQPFNAHIVDVGWAIVRDFCNLFFILILIAIALAAILRIESYDYRHLLGEVVLMALLVNFSKIIAVTIINFVNVIMITLAGNIGLKYVYSSMWSFIAQGGATLPYGGFSAALVLGIGKLVFAYMALFAFLALAGLFVVRQVGLYILVIFSPIAYVLDILPATKNFAHQWWHKFVEYLIWGPVALFMIKLTFAIINTKDFIAYGNSGESAFVFIILAAFMYASVMVAHHAGMVGADAVIHGVEHGIHRAQHFAGRRWNEYTSHLLEGHEGKDAGIGKKVAFALLNPAATYKGYETRAHELSHMAGELAAAGGREVAEQALTGGKLKIPYREFVERKEEDAFLKDYGNMKKETLMQSAVDLEGMKGAEGEVRRRSIVKAAAANGYLDDLLRMKQFASKYGEADGTIYSAEVLNRFLYGYMGNSEQSMRMMSEDMEDLGRKTKHFEYMGHAFYDNNTNSWKRGMTKQGTKKGINGAEVEDLKNDWQQDYAVGEFKKLGGRDRVNAAPHNFTAIRARLEDGKIVTGYSLAKDGKVIEDKKGTYGREIGDMEFGRVDGEFDIFNKRMVEQMNSDVMREVQHAQGRVPKWLLSEELVPNSEGSEGGVIVVKDNKKQELNNLYNTNPEFIKGLYTKALKVKGDARESLDGVRYVLEKDVQRDDKNNIIGYNKANVLTLGKPTFVYVGNPPKVMSKKDADKEAAGSGKKDEPKIILTDKLK